MRNWLTQLLGLPSGARIGWSYALRTSSAAVVSVLLCRLLHIERPIWAIVSSVVVILPELRASVSSAALRVVANIVGASVGVAISALGLPALPSLVIGLLTTAGLCRLLHIDAAARSASVSLVIVLLNDPSGILGSSESRVAQVLLGCGVSLAITIISAQLEAALSTARDGLSARERILYHQIHPLKLAVDVCGGLLSTWLLWRHALGLGLMVALAPSLAVSLAWLRWGNLSRLRDSAFGRYLTFHMTPRAEGLRLFGQLVMWAGAWQRSWLALAAGLTLIALGWTYSLPRWLRSQKR